MLKILFSTALAFSSFFAAGQQGGVDGKFGREIEHPSGSAQFKRPLFRLDFAALASYVNPVMVVETGGRWRLDINNSDHRVLRFTSATTVDASDRKPGSPINLIDTGSRGGFPPLLKPHHRYLIFASTQKDGRSVYLQANLNWVGQVDDYVAKDATDIALSFACETGASKIHREGTNEQNLEADILDALATSTGTAVLSLGEILEESTIPGLEPIYGPANPPKELTGMGLEIAKLERSSTDPYVKFACASLLSSKSVSGYGARMVYDLSLLAKVAPQDFTYFGYPEGFGGVLDYNSRYKVSREVMSELPSTAHAEAVEMATKAASPEIQYQLLTWIKRGDLTRPQMAKLITQLKQQINTKGPLVDAITLALEVSSGGPGFKNFTRSPYKSDQDRVRQALRDKWTSPDPAKFDEPKP